MSSINPPITGTAHPLPFNRLSPRDFEQLCLWLVEREGFQRVELVGLMGRAPVRLLMARWAGARWAFLCKRVRRFGPREAVAEVEKVLALPEAWRPAGLICLVTCHVSIKTRQRAQKRCGEALACDFWALAELDARIKRHPEIVAEFFQVVTPYEHATPYSTDPAAVSKAERRLGRLPTKAIPEIAPLPPGSRVPFRANALFVGRAPELRALARTLKGGKTVAIGAKTVGIGKTRLAAEFVHRYGQYFEGGVFWLSFADPAAIPAGIAGCGGPDGLGLYTEASDLSLEEQIRLVLAAWSSPLPRLLVFDNCETEELLAEWRPSGGGARVLVTSSRGQWAPALGVQPLALGVLRRPESRALLARLRPDLARDEADAIAAELGDLPLALNLAGAFLARYRYAVSPADYLAQLRQPGLLQPRSLAGGDRGARPTGHELDVARTFALSSAKLDPADPTDAQALALLNRAACFAPGEPIPRALMLATLPEELATQDPELKTQNSKLETPFAVQDALARLEELGLLEEAAEGALVLHQLLAAFTRKAAGAGVANAAQAAVEATVNNAAHELANEGFPISLLALQAHLRYVAEAAIERGDERAASLAGSLGHRLKKISDYAGARRYLEQALAIYEKILGPDHPATALSLNSLGLLLHAMGEYAAARLYYERALAIFERTLGPDHLHTALGLSGLGLLLQAKGDQAAARPCLERALAIREQALGPEHPDTAQSLNDLGILLKEVDDYAAAGPYLERALAIHERVFGPDHPVTAASLNNLGGLLQALGDHQAARSHYERALAIFERALGPDHPHTAQCLSNLGYLLHTLGDRQVARRHYERAVAIWDKALGADHHHPDVTLSLNNLGALLHEMGDHQAARPYYERALAIRERVLGPDHLDTALSLNNLGGLLHEMGDYPAARPYLERALAIREHVLGPDHPDTAASLQNLGAVLHAMGDYAAARTHHERALAILEKARGPDDPHIALSLNNLGALLHEMGDNRAARPYLERALASRERVLGPDHPDTAQSLSNLGGLLEAMGDYGAARPCLERALAIREQALGPDHPDTAGSMSNLGELLEAMGDYGAARPCLERALAIREQVLGPNHPDTAASLHNLGMLLHEMGEYAAARPYYERALVIYERTLGSDHPATALSLNNLGELLRAMGDYGAARPFLEQALAILEKALEPDHPHTRTVRRNLAALDEADFGSAPGQQEES